MDSQRDPELERTAGLIEDARAGRREAFEELFATYRKDLERVMKRRLRSGASRRFDASDVVQDALADAVQHFDSFEPRGSGSFRRWLERILENRLRMALARQSAQKRDAGREVRPLPLGHTRAPAAAEASVTSPSAAATRGEDRERVEGVLARLSPDHAEVIRLVKIREMTIARTAERMGRSENAVKKLLARALLEMREGLREP